MQIVIDISEEEYQTYINHTEAILDSSIPLVHQDLLRAVINGTPLSSSDFPNKWIPVNERLPEQDKSGCSNWHSVKVFAQIKSYTGKTEIVKGCFIEFGDVMAFELDEYPLCIPDGWDVITLDKDNRAYNEEYPEEYVELQAWMPLPEPYKASPTGAESKGGTQHDD